jgi:eukaryotic translation initiation factor 2C
MSSLIQGFSNLNLGPEMPLRPGFGTVGKSQTLRANFFAIKLPANSTIYDYEVEISPKGELRRPRKARIFELLESSPQCEPFRGHIAHDRSSRLVSAKKLPQPLQLNIRFFEEGEAGPRDDALVYIVDVKFVRALNTSEIIPWVHSY